MDDDTSDDARIDRLWFEHRAHLVNVAFRILGDIGAAEDAVQEAFARVLRTEPGSIDDERAWLVVVTSRICLDQIRSARSRLDRSAPAERFDVEPEPSTWSVGVGVDPVDRVTLDDQVQGALRVVLARLSPAERVVFVMHDVFQISFDTIATTVGRPASTCRQIATRARQRLADGGGGDRFSPMRADERRVTDAFIAACARGDLDALVAVLDPDVGGDGDFGPDVPTPPFVAGAPEVAARTLAFLGHGATLVSHPGSRTPALLAFVERRLLAIIEMTIVDGRITDLHADGRPESLAAVEAALVR